MQERHDIMLPTHAERVVGRWLGKLRHTALAAFQDQDSWERAPSLCGHLGRAMAHAMVAPETASARRG